jgi:hypothetical protein
VCIWSLFRPAADSSPTEPKVCSASARCISKAMPTKRAMFGVESQFSFDADAGRQQQHAGGKQGAQP